mmetsp:Transcript_25173/g.59883  ORF Transcript_25173/g.59883 Transcript_25173/m.59883 type:complete len:148 (+) Transcript_25173:165-608(+)
MTLSSRTKMRAATDGNAVEKPAIKKVFCYGDSLTAGTSPPHVGNFPYGPHLEDSLSRDDGNVVVRWKGLPGWTAATMNEFINDPNVGLQPILDRNPSLSLVIILAGTNDIGAYTSTSIGEDFDGGEAVTPILKLHRACLNSLDDCGD